MIKKYYLILSLILVFFLSQCSGYKPIFKTENLDFKINSYSMEGERLISKSIYSKLNLLSKSSKNKKNPRKIDLLISSSKSKTPLSKDGTGKILSYRITINIQISMNDNLTNKNLINKNFTNSLTYKIQKRYSDTIEAEKQTVNNLIEKIYENMVITLTQNIF